MHPVDQYIRDVSTDAIPAGRLVKLAVRRHKLDLKHGEDRGLWFDDEAAQGGIDFFPMLSHTTGEYDGEPFELRMWQQFIVWNLFGWKRKSDDTRRFRDAMISVGRGGGKSPFGAGLVLQLTFADIPIEPRAEGYVVATKADQARIVWEEARRMVGASGLKRFVKCQEHSLSSPTSLSSLKPLSSDGKTLDGLVTHCVVRDELHSWQEHHRWAWDKIETSLGKRRQPMGITITTAGDDRSDLWKEQYHYSCRVLEQVINPPDTWFGDDHFSFIAEVDKEDDIYDENNWPKANPMLNEPRSPVKLDHLRSMASKAEAGDVITENRFRRYHCNQMVTSTEKPITEELWLLGSDPIPDLTEFVGYGGLDLARSDDFAAVTICWPLDDDELAVRTWAWTTQKRGEDLMTAEFQSLLDCENLIIHPGDAINFQDIRNHIVGWAETYQVKAWAFDDSWARETGQFLQEEHGLNVTGIPQTCKVYNEPIVRFLDLLRRGKVKHGGDRLLAWQANNLILRRNAADLRMPDKVESQYKIDSMVALFMSYSEALFDAEPVWSDEDQGL